MSRQTEEIMDLLLRDLALERLEMLTGASLNTQRLSIIIRIFKLLEQKHSSLVIGGSQATRVFRKKLRKE